MSRACCEHGATVAHGAALLSIRFMQKSSKSRWPAALTGDSRVALIAASGPVRGEADVAIAESHVQGFGWEPVRGQFVLGQHGYLAGTDAERLADLQWALDDPTIDAVWCVRGGYGLTRILPSLSLAAFAARPKAIVGFSDVTALHCAVAARTGIVTFHAPSARSALPPMSAGSLRACLEGDGEACGIWPGAVQVRGGRVTGRLAGGNLALLAALSGTPDALRSDGAIVVLEDVNESEYRIDRMLRQLEQAGDLHGCAGLTVGQFTAVPPDENRGAMSIDALVAELAERLRVPCLSNLPFGHIADQWTLPLGASAMLDVDSRSLRVENDRHMFSITRGATP